MKPVDRAEEVLRNIEHARSRPNPPCVVRDESIGIIAAALEAHGRAIRREFEIPAAGAGDAP